MTHRPDDPSAALLASHWLFATLSEAELGRISRTLRRRKVGEGERIFDKGDPGSSMMVLVSGEVLIGARSPGNRGITFNIVKPGEIFGEIALLDGGARTADATAMCASELLVLERRDLLPLLERHPSLARKLLEVVCQRLRRTSEQVEDHLFLVRPARLAKTLLNLADEFGVDVERGVVIDLDLSQTDLGDLTGLSRESINKQLSVWRRQGVIARERGRLTLLDRRALQRLLFEAG